MLYDNTEIVTVYFNYKLSLIFLMYTKWTLTQSSLQN